MSGSAAVPSPMLEERLSVEQAHAVAFEPGGVPGKIDQELLEDFARYRTGGLLALRAPSGVEHVRECTRHQRALVRDVIIDEGPFIRGGGAGAEGLR